MKPYFLYIFIAFPLIAQAQLVFPTEEVRSLNTAAYEVSVQKNGRVDVRLVSGLPVFTNAFPLVWFADRDEPNTLPVDGRYSARQAVNDPLGRGQGIALIKDTCEWHIRTYPARAYFTVQVAYTNTKKSPVSVRALMPWAMGPPKRGEMSLGLNTSGAVILEPRKDTPAVLRNGAAEGFTHLAAANLATGQSVLLGFITTEGATPTIQLSHEAEDETFTTVRAICTYDPPVTLQPGEQLRSGVLYVAIADPTPFHALERYAEAIAAAGGEIGPTLHIPQQQPIESWRSEFPSTDPGLVEAVRAAARSYYLPNASPAFKLRLDTFSGTQRQAALTIQALLGFSPTDDATETESKQFAPLVKRAARPIDLFEGNAPRVWSYTVPSQAGDWHIAGLFNWDENEAQRFTFPLSAFGLDPSSVYTLFDFWERRFVGIAQSTLTLDVPPAAVKLIGFRRFQDRPMLLATDSHFTQGALDHKQIQWNAAAQTLTGTLSPNHSGPYTLYILVPARYHLREATSTAPIQRQALTDSILTIELATTANEPTVWTATFNN